MPRGARILAVLALAAVAAAVLAAILSNRSDTSTPSSSFRWATTSTATTTLTTTTTTQPTAPATARPIASTSGSPGEASGSESCPTGRHWVNSVSSCVPDWESAEPWVVYAAHYGCPKYEVLAPAVAPGRPNDGCFSPGPGECAATEATCDPKNVPGSAATDSGGAPVPTSPAPRISAASR